MSKPKSYNKVLVLLCFFHQYASSLKHKDVKTIIPERHRHLSQSSWSSTSKHMDYNWISEYSIQYEGCITFEREKEAQNQDNYNEENENEYEDVKENDDTYIYYERLARFRLCPADSCGKNCIGDYLVTLADFAQAYMQGLMDYQNRICQYALLNCNCQKNTEYTSQCENKCYKSAGLDECVVDEESIPLQDLLECQKLETYNSDVDNGKVDDEDMQENDDYIAYYVGPKCVHDHDINLSVFSDAYCINEVENGNDIYKSYTGYDLPYFDESIVSGECFECTYESEEEYKNDENNVDENENANMGELNSFCANIYVTYIQDRLYRNDKSTNPSFYFAWAFMFVSTGLGYLSYDLNKKLRRKNLSFCDQSEIEIRDASRCSYSYNKTFSTKWYKGEGIENSQSYSIDDGASSYSIS